MIIVAGKYISEEWFKEEERLFIVVMSDKGWISNEISLIWLKQYLEP
jgi:hypothetical protein